MKREELIQIAEDVGLLFNKDIVPYSSPAHQRLISKLEKFAVRIQRDTEEKLLDKVKD